MSAPIKNHNPVETAKRHPFSKQKAIEAFCFLCMGGGDTEHPSIIKSRVRECTSKECPLHPHRGWKNTTTRIRSRHKN